jgi:hypothetical protein
MTVRLAQALLSRPAEDLDLTRLGADVFRDRPGSVGAAVVTHDHAGIGECGAAARRNGPIFSASWYVGTTDVTCIG